MSLYGTATIGEAKLESLKSGAGTLAASSSRFTEKAGILLDAKASSEVRSFAVLGLKKLGAAIPQNAIDRAVSTLACSFAVDRMSLAPGEFLSWEDRYASWYASLKITDAESGEKDAAREAAEGQKLERRRVS